MCDSVIFACFNGPLASSSEASRDSGCDGSDQLVVPIGVVDLTQLVRSIKLMIVIVLSGKSETIDLVLDTSKIFFKYGWCYWGRMGNT